MKTIMFVGLTLLLLLGPTAAQDNPIVDAYIKGAQLGQAQRDLEMRSMETSERIRFLRLQNEVLRRQLERSDPETYQSIKEIEIQEAISIVRARHKDFDKLRPAIDTLSRDLARRAGSKLTLDQYYEVLYLLVKQGRIPLQR